MLHRHEQTRIDLPFGCPPSLVVVGSAGMALAPGVHQGVAGAAVKAKQTRATRLDRAFWQKGNVRNPADIEYRPGLLYIAENSQMKGRHQRRTLATRGQVATSKVCNHGDAATLRQQSRLVQLHGVADAIKSLRLVAHGLPMCANRLNLRILSARACKQLSNDFGVKANQGIGRECGAVQFILSPAVEGQKFQP